MTIANPKPPSINPSKIPHRIHVPEQGNPCPNSKTKAQPLPEKKNQPVQQSPNPPIPSLTSPAPKLDPNSPFITLCEIPYRSHGPKQVNPCPNSKNSSQPNPAEKTHSEKDHQTPPIPPSPSPMIKANPKPPSINPIESPHGSHGPEQGNPCPSSKTKSHPPSEKTTQPVKDPSNPPKLPRTPSSSKSDINSPFVTLCESPHRSHGPKQGNPCSNYKYNSQHDLAEKTHS